jgi:DNA gyrase subunit A
MVLMSAAGQVIRQPVSTVPRIGRNTQGVRLMGLNEGDSVVSMACMASADTPSADQDGDSDGEVLSPEAVLEVSEPLIEPEAATPDGGAQVDQHDADAE